jgi:hypothetical protein
MSDPLERAALLGPGAPAKKAKSSSKSGKAPSSKVQVALGGTLAPKRKAAAGGEAGGSAQSVPLKDLTQARNAFFVWTLWAYVCWGIISELYSNLFHDVIDKGDYAKVSCDGEL